MGSDWDHRCVEVEVGCEARDRKLEDWSPGPNLPHPRDRDLDLDSLAVRHVVTPGEVDKLDFRKMPIGEKILRRSRMTGEYYWHVEVSPCEASSFRPRNPEAVEDAEGFARLRAFVEARSKRGGPSA